MRAHSASNYLSKSTNSTTRSMTLVTSFVVTVETTAVPAAVYLHGLAGERAAAALGEQPVIATDLLQHLPEAMRVCHAV